MSVDRVGGDQLGGAEPARGYRVYCVGDAMIDLLAVLPGPLLAGSDTPAEIRVSHGGSAANTAAWLAAGGYAGTFVGRVGADAFGRDFVAVLDSAGVRPLVAVDPERPTGTCIVLVAPDGERTMVPSAGANVGLSAADLDPVALVATDRLHLSAYTLLREQTRSAAVGAMERAIAGGAGLSVDAASAGPLIAAGVETFLEVLPPDVLLLANAAEATVLAGADDSAEAAALLSRRFAQVVVKCGARGAVVGLAGNATLVAATEHPVIDSTGAGDAFAAGLLAALIDGAALVEAAARGNDWGARAVSHLGARPRG